MLGLNYYYPPLWYTPGFDPLSSLTIIHWVVEYHWNASEGFLYSLLSKLSEASYTRVFSKARKL